MSQQHHKRVGAWLQRDGFASDSVRMVREVKKGKTDANKVQILLFSATFSDEVKGFAQNVIGEQANQVGFAHSHYAASQQCDLSFLLSQHHRAWQDLPVYSQLSSCTHFPLPLHWNASNSSFAMSGCSPDTSCAHIRGGVYPVKFIHAWAHECCTALALSQVPITSHRDVKHSLTTRTDESATCNPKYVTQRCEIFIDNMNK